MDSLSGINVFVQVAETRSFTEAARLLEVSASAVGKSITRMEERLGVRLFHRSTRSITLTAEGGLFLERCRRILGEVEAAQLELSHLAGAPRGKLHISVPLQGGLIMPALAGFMREYPDIELDVDVSDRMVDVIEEGFDAVVRTGAPQDSRLMSRQLGNYKLLVVATPGYFEQRGEPHHPNDLPGHACLLHKFPASGKIERWPLQGDGDDLMAKLPRTVVCTTTESLEYLVHQGLGIACLPDFMVGKAVRNGTLRQVLGDFTEHRGTFWMLWPSSRHASPKLRVLIDYLKAHLLPV